MTNVRTPWLRYGKTGPIPMPVVSAELLLGEFCSGPCPFLVDTGAAISVIPRAKVRKIVPADAVEQWSGASDAHGERLMGIPMDLEVRIVQAPKFPLVKERFWVSPKVEYFLLGQSWFEKAGATFLNWPQSKGGRRFAMYLSSPTKG